MKKTWSFRISLIVCSIIPFSLSCLSLNAFAQQNALNIPGIHQLVDYSKSEYDLQNHARDRLAVTTTNEQMNKTMLARLKIKYRELQQRYNTIGTIINTANIGINAAPIVNQIIRNQIEIYHIAQQNPLLISLAYNTEVEFVSRSRSLVNYLVGLSASFGAVNQMKSPDRKILFDHIIHELSNIQELSASLVITMRLSLTNSTIKSLNPFQNYIDQDNAIIKDIFSNARYLSK
jgi:hypothetical protein